MRKLLSNDLFVLFHFSLIVCVCIYSLYPLVVMFINEKLKELREFLMGNLILAKNFICFSFIYCIHESFCGLTLWCVNVIEVGIDKKQRIYKYIYNFFFWFFKSKKDSDYSPQSSHIIVILVKFSFGLLMILFCNAIFYIYHRI